LGLPGGLVNQGETLKQSAIREVKEELGINIKILKQSKTIHECPKTKEFPISAINILFYAKISKGKPEPKDETQEVKWFSPKQIKKMKLAYTHKNILKKEGLI
jgi:8-oxo-dGTP diphosphatase